MENQATLPAASVPSENKAGSPASRLLDKSAELKRRGTPPGAKRGPYNKGETPRPASAAPATGPLFNEQNFTRLVAIPFDFMAVRTNIGNWSLDEQEKKELAVSGVPCFNEFVGVNPKWASLAIFSLSLVAISASKAMAYAAWLRHMEVEAAKSRKSPPPPPPASVNLSAGTPAGVDPKTGESALLPLPNAKQ